MIQRAPTLLAMVMAATSFPGVLASIPKTRKLEKQEPSCADLERIAKAKAKRARKNAARQGKE